MKMKKVLAGLLTLAMLPVSAGIMEPQSVQAAQDGITVPTEKVLTKSTMGNPFLGFGEDGELAYGGDPSILVDGDTVYAYVGHDTAPGEYYQIPEYYCYSSKDLVNWKYENMIMNMKSVNWRVDNNTAWAAQVMKFKGKYYLLFCTTANWPGQNREHCIGVAECDTPDGDFVPVQEPLILSSQTGLTGQMGASSAWSDIDPTGWVETDENGEEHLYITWGNVNTYSCEADVDADGHLYVIDQDKDGQVTLGEDIKYQTVTGYPSGWNYTEAPWIYRRQDEDGNYYGKYYMFFAAGWREQMAYATADSIMTDTWEWGGELMPPTATSNTNHEAVFDFNGKTYFVYHNGQLTRGSGYRRSACITEIEFNEDGSLDPILETSTGLSGFTSTITDTQGVTVSHEKFVNPTADPEYPLKRGMLMTNDGEEEDALWELEEGKSNPDNDAYVSIQSYNKPGLYISADENGVILTPDADGAAATREKITFRSLEGFAGYGTTFESVYMPGYYLVSEDGDLKLSRNPDAESCTFLVDSDSAPSDVSVLKTKRLYTVGSKLNVDDMRVTVTYENGDKERVTNYTTNADEIDMSTTGRKKLTVTYEANGETVSKDVTIRVVEESQTW